MAHVGASTVQAGAGGPKPVPQPPPSERVEQKRDLTSWWKNFKRSEKKQQEPQAAQGIFGVPLQSSIRYANVAISLLNDEGQSYIYGYVPIVVAKCGVFLKEKATDVEGIFRLAGSEKRIKELKVAFDSPDRYGKGLDWTGYTVHDAANILRRYFNQLPEPIIPLEFYDLFREPLRAHQAQATGALGQATEDERDPDEDVVIRKYQRLITELPPLNRQLLLYILDLLAVFASKSDFNKMTTGNLAAIFQPGTLSHPSHDMAPQEYRLSQDVLIFLIENQDSFLIGMQGTAADPDTVRAVQSGTPSPSKVPASPSTPTRAKTVVGRSDSNASAGADSVRKWGNVRRNVSVSSSKHSKRSQGGPVPVTAPMGSPATTPGGVHRSNTAPSRRGNSNGHSRFSRDQKSSDPPTPSPDASSTKEPPQPRQESLQTTPIATGASQFPPLAPPEVTSASSSEVTTPLATFDTASTITRDFQTPKKDTTPLLAPPGTTADTTPRSPSETAQGTSGRGFLGLLKQSPSSDGEGRKPNKLQKKRIPGSALSSAQSSSHSLHDEGAYEIPQRSPIRTSFLPESKPETPTGTSRNPSTYATPATKSPPVQATQQVQQRSPTEASLRPGNSPTRSFQSQTDTDDADLVGDDLPHDIAGSPGKEKRKHRWRFSRSQNKLEPGNNGIGMMTPKEQAMSQSTVGSTIGSQPRKSLQDPAPLTAVATDPALGSATPTPPIQASSTEPVFSDSERERKGPMSWIRGKLQERKDRDVERRARTPDRHRERGQSKTELPLPPSNEGLAVRGKSFEQQRANVLASGGSTTTSASVSGPNHNAQLSQASPRANDANAVFGKGEAKAATKTNG